MADVSSIEWLPIRSVEARSALVTVDAIGVMPAVLTHTSSVEDTVDVETLLLSIYFFIIDAFIRVPEAVAGFANMRVIYTGSAPFLLLESWAALLALGTAGVVLAAAVKLCWSSGFRYVASIRMAVADTPTSDVDVFNTVKIPASNRWILTFDRHKMAQQCLCPQETHANIGGFGPLLQLW